MFKFVGQFIYIRVVISKRPSSTTNDTLQTLKLIFKIYSGIKNANNKVYRYRNALAKIKIYTAYNAMRIDKHRMMMTMKIRKELRRWRREKRTKFSQEKANTKTAGAKKQRNNGPGNKAVCTVPVYAYIISLYAVAKQYKDTKAASVY